MTDWFDEWLNEEDEQIPREATVGETIFFVALAAIVILILALTAMAIASLVIGLATLILIKSPIALWAAILAAVAAVLWWDRERQS